MHSRYLISGAEYHARASRRSARRAAAHDTVARAPAPAPPHDLRAAPPPRAPGLRLAARALAASESSRGAASGCGEASPPAAADLAPSGRGRLSPRPPSRRGPGHCRCFSAWASVRVGIGHPPAAAECGGRARPRRVQARHAQNWANPRDQARAFERPGPGSQRTGRRRPTSRAS